jgi:hypothetical protein
LGKRKREQRLRQIVTVQFRCGSVVVKKGLMAERTLKAHSNCKEPGSELGEIGKHFMEVY